MNCPYCKSNDISEYGNEIDEQGIFRKLFRCYNCARVFDRRKIPNCGNKTFHYGDNFPNFKIEREKFKDKGVVPKAKRDDIVNLWIDLWDFMKGKTKEKKE